MIAFFDRIRDFELYFKKVPERIFEENIPYYSQVESSNLTDSILYGGVCASEDPLWENSGAMDLYEYEHWVKSICGMACLKMILEHRNNRVIKTIDVGKKCRTYGAYVIHEKGDISGLIFTGLKKYLANEFGIKMTVKKYLSLRRILYEHSRGNYVMVSVDSSISDMERRYRGNKGGHLVLITGYDLSRKILFIHNPSGIFQKSQQHYEISIENFMKIFAKRGMIIPPREIC